LVILIVGVAALVVSQAWLRVGAPASRAGGSLSVVASIPPLEWVAESLAPGGARITSLVSIGAECHAVEPSPAQAASVREADLVLVAGGGVDDAVGTAARSAIDAPVLVSMAERVDPGTEREWTDGARHDPHRWLDPIQMRVMVEASSLAMAEAGRRAGLSSEAIAQTVQRLPNALTQCDEADRYCREQLSGLGGTGLVAAHPGGHWFAERYGLRIVVSLGSAHGAESTPGDLARASEALRSGAARAILVEPGHVSGEVRALAESTGAPIVALAINGDGDWPAMVRANADALAAALAANPERTE